MTRNDSKTVNSYLNRKIPDLLFDIECYVIDTMYPDKTILGANNSKSGQEKRKSKHEIKLTVSQKNKVLNAVAEILEQSGVSLKVKGGRMIGQCVVISVTETVNGRPYYLMKMYPEIAKMFGVTENNAEKLCRYVCKCIDINSNGAVRLGIIKKVNNREFKEISLRDLIDLLNAYVLEICQIKIASR